MTLRVNNWDALWRKDVCEEGVQHRKAHLIMKGGGDASGKGCEKSKAAFLMKAGDASSAAVIGCEMNAQGLLERFLSFRDSEGFSRANDCSP